jgi:hypothetical protein
MHGSFFRYEVDSTSNHVTPELRCQNGWSPRLTPGASVSVEYGNPFDVAVATAAATSVVFAASPNPTGRHGLENAACLLACAISMRDPNLGRVRLKVALETRIR